MALAASPFAAITFQITAMRRCSQTYGGQTRPPPTSSDLKLNAPLSALKVAGGSHRVQRAGQFLSQAPGPEGVADVETGVPESDRDAALATRLPDRPQAPGPSVQDRHGSGSRVRRLGAGAEWTPTRDHHGCGWASPGRGHQGALPAADPQGASRERQVGRPPSLANRFW